MFFDNNFHRFISQNHTPRNTESIFGDGIYTFSSSILFPVKKIFIIERTRKEFIRRIREITSVVINIPLRHIFVNCFESTQVNAARKREVDIHLRESVRPWSKPTISIKYQYSNDIDLFVWNKRGRQAIYFVVFWVIHETNFLFSKTTSIIERNYFSATKEKWKAKRHKGMNVRWAFTKNVNVLFIRHHLLIAIFPKIADIASGVIMYQILLFIRNIENVI